MLGKQVSFIVDHKGNRQAAVVPIDIFDELMALQKALASSTPGERERYYFSVKGAEATGYPVGQRQKPGFVVLAGSRVNGEQAGSLREPVIELREQLLGKGVLQADASGYVFLQDQLFNSPSLAASLIAGNNRSGLDAWRNQDGFTLKESGFGKKI
ncbi:DUF4357 domain-containing protein [Pseudaeromonas sharmana]|uniref:DUF4357 domain-containing protein n=1 Tax=Pseudaeromonas sharmana TaxID=328412 RepID=A0ABV8CQU3_9GAMM